jgi:glycine dehydrogenase subunit 2
MIEPPETECKEDLDLLIDTLEAIVHEAKENPGLLQEAPTNPKVRRLDETSAARHPCLRG